MNNHKLNCQCFICKFKRGEKVVHSKNCVCIRCKSKRGEKHKPDCGCVICLGKMGKYKGINNPNYKGDKALKRQNHFCIDCGGKISYDTLIRGKGRCSKCYHKFAVGKNAPRFKHGKYLKNNHCVDCNKKISVGAKRCKSCGAKNRIKPCYYVDGHTTIKKFCIDCGKKINWASKRCQKCSNKNLWKNEIHKTIQRKKMLNGLLTKPNVPEKKLGELLNELFPKNYRYVGNGKVILGGFCPDFINVNGQKKIIELNGLYWHTKDKYVIKKDQRKLREYKKLGYKTLVIWENELKDINKVKEKVLEFNNGK